MRRTGFTALDLLIVCAVVVFLGAFTVLLADNADNTRNRVRCASNLRQIGQAILLYANENRGAYPRATYDHDKADKLLAYTNPDAQPTDDERANNWRPPFVKAGPGPNDVTAPMFLLVMTEDITPAVFICPSVGEATTQPAESPDPKKQCNFSSPSQLSYSFANPYPSDAAVDAGYKLDINTLPADFAVAADINPGVDDLLTINTKSDAEEMKKVNSPNHNGLVQNVLYADGHVEVQNQPFCGVARDNIYTYGKSGQLAETSGGEGIVGSPSNDKDSVLLPTAKQGKAEDRGSKVEDRK